MNGGVTRESSPCTLLYSQFWGLISRELWSNSGNDEWALFVVYYQANYICYFESALRGFISIYSIMEFPSDLRLIMYTGSRRLLNLSLIFTVNAGLSAEQKGYQITGDRTWAVEWGSPRNFIVAEQPAVDIKNKSIRVICASTLLNIRWLLLEFGTVTVSFLLGVLPRLAAMCSKGKPISRLWQHCCEVIRFHVTEFCDGFIQSLMYVRQADEMSTNL